MAFQSSSVHLPLTLKSQWCDTAVRPYGAAATIPARKTPAEAGSTGVIRVSKGLGSEDQLANDRENARQQCDGDE